MSARAMVHDECGQPVFLVDGELFEPWGAEHLCRDYLVWHLPPDRRDPGLLDVAGGSGSGLVGHEHRKPDRVVPLGLNG